jgi:NAD-dependent deacetylase
MKKIVALTGAGISKESGIQTFRDTGGMWHEYNVDEVASLKGWRLNREKVLDFYNQRRSDLLGVKPNLAHKLLADLQDEYDVTIITQNVDDLHEKAGSKKILHLHGSLLRAKIEDLDDVNPESIVIGYNDIKIGDTPSKYRIRENPRMLNQLRPDIVWFGEGVPLMPTAEGLVFDADIVLVIGTTLQVYPAAGLMEQANNDAEIFVINPEIHVSTSRKLHLIEKTATEGMQIFVDSLKTK